MDWLARVDCELNLECIRFVDGGDSIIPPRGPEIGERSEGKAGEVWKCCRDGLRLGVEAMPDAEFRKLVFSIPGV